MSVVIPPNLNEIYRTMSGYRKQMIRFYPDRSGVINAGEVLRYTVPKKIIDLKTLMKYFEFTSTASQTGSSTRRIG